MNSFRMLALLLLATSTFAADPADIQKAAYKDSAFQQVLAEIPQCLERQSTKLESCRVATYEVRSAEFSRFFVKACETAARTEYSKCLDDVSKKANKVLLSVCSRLCSSKGVLRVNTNQVWCECGP